MCFDCCGLPVYQFSVWNSPPVPLVPTYHGRVIPGYAVPPRSLRPLAGRNAILHAPSLHTPVGGRSFAAPVVVPGQNQGLHPGRVTSAPAGGRAFVAPVAVPSQNHGLNLSHVTRTPLGPRRGF